MSGQFKFGRTKSCGCWNLEAIALRNTKIHRTHGLSRTRAYQCWTNMLYRCRPDHDQRKYYYDRGICVCERWLLFLNFLEDMGEPPAGMTLDRIDNDKGYEKSNCRWATQLQQRHNQRRMTKPNHEVCV
jgi:hypothetical protein